MSLLPDYQNHSSLGMGMTKRKTNIDTSDFKRVKTDEQRPSKPSPPRPSNGSRDGSFSPPGSPDEQDIDQTETDELSKINWSAGRRREKNGLFTCLYDRRRSILAQSGTRKKSVRFVSQEKLVKIRFFEENDEEKAQRENVYKTKLMAEADGTDIKQREMARERSVLTQAAEMEQSRHKASIDENPWIAPPLIAQLTPPLAERGKNSVDKISMFARQATALSALFLDRENLPDSPDEPSEPPVSSEGKSVSLIRSGMNLALPPVPIIPKGPIPIETSCSPAAPSPVQIPPVPVAPTPTHNPISFSLKPMVNSVNNTRPSAVNPVAATPVFPNAQQNFPTAAVASSLPPGVPFAAPTGTPSTVRSPTNPVPNYGFPFPVPSGNSHGVPAASSIPPHAQDIRGGPGPSYGAPQQPAVPPTYSVPYQNGAFGPAPPAPMGWPQTEPGFQANRPPPQPSPSRLQAKPCLFFGSPTGCRSGSACRFSHMNPTVNGRR